MSRLPTKRAVAKDQKLRAAYEDMFTYSYLFFSRAQLSENPDDDLVYLFNKLKETTNAVAKIKRIKKIEVPSE